jgi:hypothetical protein
MDYGEDRNSLYGYDDDTEIWFDWEYDFFIFVEGDYKSLSFDPIFEDDEIIESRDIYDLLKFMDIIIFVEEDDDINSIDE